MTELLTIEDLWHPNTLSVFILTATLVAAARFGFKSRVDLLSKLGKMAGLLYTESVLFLRTPKDYLYLFFLSDNEKVKMEPYTKELEVTAEKVISQIKKTVPGLRVHFIGSAKLGVFGERDIDLYIEALSKDFAKHFSALKEAFGLPKKKKKLSIDWNFILDGNNVEVSLVDPSEKSFRRSMTVFNALLSDQDLLNRYVELKLSLKDSSVREYIHTRMKFFDQVIYQNI